MTEWTHNDGGRAAAGFLGETSDCATRSIAIATGASYRTVYDRINILALDERPRGRRQRSHARTGVHTPTIRRYLESVGWVWVPTMHIGSGCQMHLRADELPAGRLVIRCSKHITAMIDGIIHDTFDPSRNGTRCVYGYWLAGE